MTRQEEFEKWWARRKSSHRDKLVAMSKLMNHDYKTLVELAYYAGLDKKCIKGLDCPCYRDGYTSAKGY